MNHIPQMIIDLCFILVVAAPVSLLFRKLNQPVVLGYLVAGFLVGPFVPLIPTIKDHANLSIWSEIGVIFLLFSMGLEFSFKKLRQVGSTSAVIGVVEVGGMILLGMVAALTLGYQPQSALFVGCMLAISSTSVLIKTFEELKLRSKGFVQDVFGLLVIEDLLAILMLVVLTAVFGATNSDSVVVHILQLLIKLVFFLTFTFVAGSVLLPWIFSKTQKYSTGESLLIFAVGFCFLNVLVSSQLGFSSSLGAFIAGSLIAGTSKGHEIEQTLLPLKNLFSAIFFVSIGMMIDPTALIQSPLKILILASVVMLGKPVLTFLASRWAGIAYKNAVPLSLSVSQIGEFSFLIALLGIQTKVLSQSDYSVIIAVATLTAFTTPIWIRRSERVSEWVMQKWPVNSEFLNKNQTFSHPNEVLGVMQGSNQGQSNASANQKLEFSSNPSALLNKIKRSSLRWFVNAVFIIVITQLMSGMVLDAMNVRWTSAWVPRLTLLANLLFASPFFWPILLKSPSIRLAGRARGLYVSIKTVITFLLLGYLFLQYPSDYFSTGVFTFFLFTMFGLIRLSGPFYRRIETQFLDRMNSDDSRPESDVKVPWDLQKRECVIDPHAKRAGYSIAEMRVREMFGVNIVLIERNAEKLWRPAAHARLLPYDTVHLVGEEEQLERAFDYLSEIDEAREEQSGLAVLKDFIIPENHPLIDTRISELSKRYKNALLILGLEREGRRFTVFESDFVFKENDHLWLYSKADDLEAVIHDRVERQTP